MTKAITTSPPATPPAIAPTFELLLEEEEEFPLPLLLLPSLLGWGPLEAEGEGKAAGWTNPGPLQAAATVSKLLKVEETAPVVELP